MRYELSQLRMGSMDIDFPLEIIFDSFK